MMFNGSVERKEITKHPRLNFEKNTFSNAHIVLSSRSSSLDGRVSQHQTWSRSMIWTSDGFWKSLTCACGRRPYGDGYIDWWKGTSEPETMVLPIKLNGDLCEKLPLNQSNAYFGGYFRVNRNVSRLLPTASFSWIQLFVYLEDLDPAKLYGMYVQKNIP